VSTFEQRRRARAGWPIRAVPLGEEELIDPRDESSVDERIALVWTLTRQLWDFTGRPFPQIGLPPRRIDILTAISGVTFEEAVSDPVVAHLGGHTVRCIGFDALLRNKRACGRTKDLADAEALQEIQARRG
jgi:hypothetical protein